MVREVFSPESLYLLARDPRAPACIEALIIDHEAALHFAIGARTCQIAKMRFRQQPRALFKPTRALSTERLLACIRALVKTVNNIERLAQLRAARHIRERDADPLGLLTHGSPNALNGVWLRHAAHHEAVGVFSIFMQAKAGLMVSSTRSVRPSNHEAVLTARATSPRGAPPTIASRHQEPASQAHLRDRGPMRHSSLRRAFCPVCPRPHEMAPRKSI